MPLTFRDPGKGSKRDYRESVWDPIMDEIREDGSGRWVVISEDHSVTAIYKLRKKYREQVEKASSRCERTRGLG